MFPESLRRTLAGLLIAAQLFPTLVLAGYECSTTTTGSSSGTGLGSVFSVIGDGTITIHNDDKCSVSFANGSIVNTSSASKYTAPGSTDDKACKDIISGDTVKSSGNSGGARTLDTFSSSGSNFSIELVNNDQLKINGHDYGFNPSSEQIVTVDGRTFKIPMKGQPFAVPAGEYGTVKTQNGLPISIAGSSKIKSLECASTATNITVAPGTYFIDSMTWGDECNIFVSDTPGTATLNFKSGLTLGKSGVCVNFIDCGKVKSPASLTSAASLADYAEQHPERLQINIYDGNFTASDRAEISAGIYVANGDASLTAASGFVIVGEILAKEPLIN